MKETLIGISAIVLFLFMYLNMPITWRRHKDIQVGNHLISQIQNYQKQHHRLPENHEDKILQQLGFHKNEHGWQPNYRKINTTQFQIVYADGYSPPFLAWDTQTQTWALIEK